LDKNPGTGEKAMAGRTANGGEYAMKVLVKGLLGAAALAGMSLPAYADTTLTIATVNNGDMIRMQKLTDDFYKSNPDIKLNWVTLEENVLRQKVTTDIATKGGQFDVLTIGTYEVPIWGKKGWLVPLDKLGADYDADDLLPAIKAGLTVDGKLVLIRLTKCAARHLDVVAARAFSVRVGIPVGRMLSAEHEPVAGTPLAEP
jgi:Bacterial extracellular solute-binding protein